MVWHYEYLQIYSPTLPDYCVDCGVQELVSLQKLTLRGYIVDYRSSLF